MLPLPVRPVARRPGTARRRHAQPVRARDRGCFAQRLHPGPDGLGVSLAGGSSLAVCRSSRQPEAARSLVAYLTDPEQQFAFYRLTGDLPARRSAWSHPDLAHAPHTEAFRRQLDQVRPTPKIPEWERIADKISHFAEKAVRGELGEDEALVTLNVEVDRILAKRRWLLDQAASRERWP
ncbi:MAG: extracellular solute-binding protein [Methylococcus sp.]|nr:MAG: extracellular solute-binding protein [Methylococcus sp.]